MGREKTAAATVTQNKVPESAQRTVASLGRKTTWVGEEKDCEKSLRSLKRLWEKAREREQRNRAVIGCAASRATASKASAPPSATYSSSSSAVHAGSVVAAQN